MWIFHMFKLVTYKTSEYNDYAISVWKITAIRQNNHNRPKLAKLLVPMVHWRCPKHIWYKFKLFDSWPYLNTSRLVRIFWYLKKLVWYLYSTHRLTGHNMLMSLVFKLHSRHWQKICRQNSFSWNTTIVPDHRINYCEILAYLCTWIQLISATIEVMLPI